MDVIDVNLFGIDFVFQAFFIPFFQNSETCVKNMIENVVHALESWYENGCAIMVKIN